ncbi:hypothetical protein [Poseidonia sp.]|uniref:hypothetical protein n=1 Tax=Poseidonia sp. TaxID=2666344 RepID=UPI003F69596D
MYLLPRINAAFPSYTVRLARLPTVSQATSNRTLSGVLNWCNPDAIITLVENGTDGSPMERALATIEFSEAAHSDDHVMQRVHQVLPCVAYDLVHIKISSHSLQSPRPFGGVVTFNAYSVPRVFQDIFGTPSVFYPDWGLDNPTTLSKDPLNPSCPEATAVPYLTDILEAMNRAILGGLRPVETNTSYSNGVFNALDTVTQASITAARNTAPDAASLCSTWSTMTIKPTKGYHTTRIASSPPGPLIYETNINRFEKAAPAPGTTQFRSLAYNGLTVGTNYFGRERSVYIDSNQTTDVSDLVRQLRTIITTFCDKMGGGLWGVLNTEMTRLSSTALSSQSVTIDITAAMQTLVAGTTPTLWVKTLSRFTDYLAIRDRPNLNCELIFTWDRTVIWSTQPPFNHVNLLVNSNTILAHTPLTLVQDGLHRTEEDTVTWFAVQALQGQGCQIHAVSYPGAQGGAVIMLGVGRTAPKVYLDMFSSGLSVNPTSVILWEFKKNLRELQPDVEKLENAKINQTAEITTGLGLLGVTPTSIMTGVGCHVNDRTDLANTQITSWQGQSLDYIFLSIEGTMTWELIDTATLGTIATGPLATHQMELVS